MMDQRGFLRMIEPILKPIKTRIMMAIARGILESVKDDAGIQAVKVSLLKDEVRDNIERVQNFGFTSNPPANSEIVAVFVGGNREHGFVIAADSRAHRLKNLLPGESAMYSSETGHYVALKQGGKVRIGNSSAELVAILSDTLQALSTEPFIVNKATFLGLKTLLDTMKV